MPNGTLRDENGVAIFDMDFTGPPIPAARNVMLSASVPLLQATACLAPVYRLTASSSRATVAATSGTPTAMCPYPVPWV